MKQKKYNAYLLSIWGSMANYMEFYQAWVTICATVNRSVDNPNRALARRWNVCEMVEQNCLYAVRRDEY